MDTLLTRTLDAAFGHPRGLAGRLGGAIMATANADTERGLVARAGLGPQDTVLVVGPGPGVGLYAAAQAVPEGEAIGVDPSEEMLRQARQRCAALEDPERVRLHQGTAANTGQPDASVDVVFTVNNVQLWEDRTAALAELFRVLRPGGRLLLSVTRKFLNGSPATLRLDVECAGFVQVLLQSGEPRALIGSSYELTARRP